MNRGILKVLLLAAFAALAIAGATSRGASAESPPPAVIHPAGKGEFRGSVRHIPQGNLVRSEDRPGPKSPNGETPPSTLQPDPVRQSAAPSVAAPSPSNTFAGLDQHNWGAGWPPDTNGDVGPAYYIQTVNTSIGIFNKAGGAPAAEFTFNSLFGQSQTGTPCDNSNQGDPVVVYDPIGDRWVIADFAWTNYTSGAMYECMAVSKSSDPVSGGWYFYAWQIANGGVLPDYPKLGVWPDGIYMSANDFATTGTGSFQNVQVWAFDRVAMEAGAQSPAGVTFSLPKTSGGVTLFSLLPSNSRSVTGLPPAGSPNYFASIYGSYAIRIWKFHVDYATPSSSTLTGPTNVPIATFSVGPGNVPEKSGNNVDTLSYRLMMQNQYTNLGGKESLWLTHTVGNGGSPNVAQPRWYQLNITGGAVPSSPTQQSTWAPDSKNRFMPSLAVDKAGDMAIGYSVSDGTMFPSIRYAGRLVGDPANTLGQGEASLIEGTGFQCCVFSDGTTNTRWGDYSAMTIDPDGCTFWYTNEYYANAPATLSQDDWRTQIGSFAFPSCSNQQQPAAPTITSFSPTSGAVGSTVTITGSGFTGASSVTFNGTASTYTLNSNTQITATVPSGATTGPIAVTTAGGTGTSATNFGVTATVAAPSISSFSPNHGPVGTTVTINGTNFSSPIAVKFNGVTAASTPVSATQVRATVPSGASTGRITVMTSGGTATSGSNFRVR